MMNMSEALVQLASSSTSPKTMSRCLAVVRCRLLQHGPKVFAQTPSRDWQFYSLGGTYILQFHLVHKRLTCFSGLCVIKDDSVHMSPYVRYGRAEVEQHLREQRTKADLIHAHSSSERPTPQHRSQVAARQPRRRPYASRDRRGSSTTGRPIR